MTFMRVRTVHSVWPWMGSNVARDSKQRRGQDESDGPAGVYAVGLTTFFYGLRAAPGAVVTRNTLCSRGFGGTIHPLALR